MHPDVLLAQLTSRQVAEWIAYASIEKVGDPVEIKTEEGEQKARRSRVEGGLKSLVEKQSGAG